MLGLGLSITQVALLGGVGVPAIPDPRTALGLISRSDGTLTGWSGNDGSFAATSKPAIVAAPASSILALSPGAGGASDAGGVREGYLWQESDSLWYIFYGAGDGTSGAGGPWRVQLAKSTNKGASWTKLGVLIDLTDGTGPGTPLAATDLLYVEKRGGFYYVQRMRAGAVSGNNQVPNQPYTSDIWKSANIEGPYSFLRVSLDHGSGSDFDAVDAYSSCTVLDGGTYYRFYSATSVDQQYRIGLATSATVEGPWVKIGASIIPDAIRGQPENPDVFWHAEIGRWTMLTNQVDKVAGLTNFNRAFFSTSLTDWSAATFCDYQRVCPADGQFVIGLGKGTRKADNSVAFDAAGNFATIFDSDPLSANAGGHEQRKLKYAQLEVSGSELALTYTPPLANAFTDDFSAATLGQLGGQNGWTDASGSFAKPAVVNSSGTKVLDMGSAVGESRVVRTGTTYTNCRMSMVAQFVNATSVGQMFAYLSDSQPYFLMDWDASSPILYFNDGAGNFNALHTATRAIAPTGLERTYSVAVVGNTVIASVDSQPWITYSVTDTAQKAVLARGGGVGLRNGAGGTGSRVVKSFTVANLASLAVPLIRAAAHDDFVMEFAVNTATLQGGMDVFYRLQSAGNENNGYQLTLNLGGNNAVAAAIGKVVAGSRTSLVVEPLSTATAGPRANFWHRVRISVAGGSHIVTIDGEQQFSVTDSTFTSGVAAALAPTSHRTTAAGIRGFSLRKGNAVTVNGLTNGQTVTLRGASGIPLATVTASGTSATLTAPHYPASSIDVAGTERYAPAGGIWGGDVFG